MVAGAQGGSAGRRVILHCGLQKTATTSFHRLCETNAAALAPHIEILTPRRGSLTRALGRAAMEFSLDPRAEDGFRARLADIRAHLLAGQGTTLISHENLLGAMPGNDRSGTLYPRAADILALIDGALSPLVAEIVIVTRQMPGWLRSVHNQAVRSDAYPGTWDDFARENAGITEWTALADRLGKACGDRLTMLQLETMTDLPGAGILRHAGVPDTVVHDLPRPRRPKNQSLGSGALEFLRQVNAAGLARPARRTVADLVSRNPGLFTREMAD